MLQLGNLSAEARPGCCTQTPGPHQDFHLICQLSRGSDGWTRAACYQEEANTGIAPPTRARMSMTRASAGGAVWA